MSSKSTSGKDIPTSSGFFCNPHDGFTLIELLLAITILAFIIGTLYTTFWGTMNNTERIRKTSRIYQTGRLILTQLISDLESTYYNRSLTRKEGSQDRVPVFKGEEVTGDKENERLDRLSFLTTSPRILDVDSQKSLVWQVSYSLEENKDTGGYRLIRRAVPYPENTGVSVQAEDTGEEKLTDYDFVLSNAVKSFRLEYINMEGDKSDSWDSERGSSEEVVPAEVNISVTLDNPDGEPITLSTRVFVPVSSIKE